MRKLEEFVIEKLRVTKASGVPSLISILESTDRKEYNLQCENLRKYLIDDSDLPIAELKVDRNGLKSLNTKYQNDNDTFLWVGKIIFYGTWDDKHSMYWSNSINGVKNYSNGVEGFKDFVCNDQEIMQSKGVFVITGNEELMRQIGILMKKSDHIR